MVSPGTADAAVVSSGSAVVTSGTAVVSSGAEVFSSGTVLVSSGIAVVLMKVKSKMNSGRIIFSSKAIFNALSGFYKGFFKVT